MLLVGMALGTGWAIRGQFGHEQGAAWAGAIGSMSILLVAKRQDWFNKVFSIVLAGAIGWGVGGMMSYGMVVGYGRASDFVNVCYGLLMLFVIGGLYGFIGGGLFGLSLGNSSKKSVNWAGLIVEMVAGGIIFYYFLIEQIGWLMTPPRSEVWAVCLGMAVALTWNMIRNENYSALRVAVFSGLGGGFGFAFGNFLQVLGYVSGIKFNFWNVMEYSLGFFGGLGMAYGTFTSKWEKSEDIPPKTSQLFPLLIVVLVIPFIVWQQSFETKRIEEMLTKINELQTNNLLSKAVEWGSLVIIVAMGLLFLYKFYIKKANPISYNFGEIRHLFIILLGVYIILSFLITGAFLSVYRIEQYLYVLNLLALSFLLNLTQPIFSEVDINYKKWSINLAAVIILIAIFSLIAINTHSDLKGAHQRFSTETKQF